MPIAPVTLALDEYWALPVTNLPHELIDGELRMPAAPHRRHQEISANIHQAPRNHRLISDILDLRKIEAGKIALQAEAFAVPRILEDFLVIARRLPTATRTRPSRQTRLLTFSCSKLTLFGSSRSSATC